MNRVISLAACLAVALPAAPVAAETLREAVAAATLGNPTLAAARARQDALAETPEQAGGWPLDGGRRRIDRL
jgi:outer membrane protein